MGAPATVYTEETDYPYYANTPPELLPFRDLEPYYRYWLTRLPFRGPGQEYPDPPNLTSLKVGLLSPAPYGPEGERGQRTRNGVVMAFDEANAVREVGQLPFEVVERKDTPQWGSAAPIAVEFADMGALGFLGTIDGDATHVALRATLKTEVYMINTSDPDPTLTETQIPWLTRVFPDDRQQCILLADLVVRQHGCKRIVVFRESSRPGRVGVMHFIHYVGVWGILPFSTFSLSRATGTLVRRSTRFGPRILTRWCFMVNRMTSADSPPNSARQGSRRGFSDSIGSRRMHFGRTPGEAAEGMTIAYFFNPWRTDPVWVDFVERYQQRYGMRPDVYAAYGYDGARLMIEAIDHAGPNRWRIRDYLAGLDEWDGVTGRMIFDGRWDNIKPIKVARFQGGQWHFDLPTDNAPAPNPQLSRQ
jgi:branched-chain amino acid transport system substrate-binding protein